MDSRSVGLPEGFEWAGPQTSPTTAPSGLPPGFEWDDQTTTDTAQDSEPGPQGYIANFLQAIKGVPEGMVSGVANEVLYPSVNRFKQGVESFKQGDPVLGGLQLAASVPGAEYVANLNGKASQAIHDLRSGNFGSAAVNAVEALPMGQTVKGAMDAFYQGAVEQFAKDPSINVATNPLGQLHGNLAGFALMEAAPKIAKSPAGKAVLETAGRVATNPIVGGVGTYLATGSSWKAVEVAGALSALKTKTGLGALKSYLPKYTHPILDKVFARGGEITAEEMAALAKAEAKTQKGRDQFAMDQLKLARDQVKAEDAIAAQKEAARLKLDKAAEAETIKAGTTEAKTIEAADKARAAVEKQAEAETITSAKSEVGLLEAGDRGQANLIKQSEAEAMSSGSIEAQILEMSQKAQAQAEAELFRARERASKAQGVEKGRAEHALALAKLKAERAVERTQSAQGRAEAAQIHREFRQRTQLDKAEARKKPPAPDQSLPEAPPEPPPTAPQLPQELPEWTPPPPEPLVAPEGPRRVGRWPRPYYSPRGPGKMVELPPEPRPKDTPRLPKPETTAIAQYYQIDPAKSTHIEGMVGVHPTLGLPMNAEGKVLVRNAEEFNMNRAPGSSPKGNLVWRDPNRAYGANPSVMQMADIVNARVAPKAPIPSIAEQLSAQLRPDHVDRFKVPKDTPALADIRKESMARIEGDVVNAPPAFPGQQSAKGANNARFNRNQARLKGMRGENLSADEIASLTDVDKRDIIKALEEKAALESPAKPPDVESTATQPKTAVKESPSKDGGVTIDTVSPDRRVEINAAMDAYRKKLGNKSHPMLNQRFYHGKASDFKDADLMIKPNTMTTLSGLGPAWFTTDVAQAHRFSAPKGNILAPERINITRPLVIEGTKDSIARGTKLRQMLDLRGKLTDFENTKRTPEQTAQWESQIHPTLVEFLEDAGITKLKTGDTLAKSKYGNPYPIISEFRTQLDNALSDLKHPDADPFNRLRDLEKEARVTLRSMGIEKADTMPAGEAIRTALQAEGYDGIILSKTMADAALDSRPSDWVIPFNPEQVVRSKTLVETLGSAPDLKPIAKPAPPWGEPAVGEITLSRKQMEAAAKKIKKHYDLKRPVTEQEVRAEIASLRRKGSAYIHDDAHRSLASMLEVGKDPIDLWQEVKK